MIQTINCNGTLISFETPQVMGILNITPNSFFDGGKFNSIDEALKQTERMLNEGANIIDVGAQSTNPKASAISKNEEEQRLLPVLERLTQRFPKAIFSVDTFRAELAEKTIACGAHIINDISGGLLDDKMLETVGKLGVPYILMHMRGTPQTMQTMTNYDDLVKEMIFYFSERIHKAREAGIIDLIIDPGFGFAKTTEQNFEILKKLNLFKQLDTPILAALSRKSMIYKTLNITSEEALNGTTALHMSALMNGANMLRVHDVKEAVQCIQLFQQIKHS